MLRCCSGACIESLFYFMDHIGMVLARFSFKKSVQRIDVDYYHRKCM